MWVLIASVSGLCIIFTFFITPNYFMITACCGMTFCFSFEVLVKLQLNIKGCRPS